MCSLTIRCPQDYHHDHGPHQRWAGDVRECDKGEDFCITITHTDKTDGFAFRGCWSTEYEEGRYNFTGCEVRVRQCLIDTLT